MLRSQFNTLYEWIHAELAKIAGEFLLGQLHPKKITELFRTAQSAANGYANNVGRTFTDILLENKEKAIKFGLKTFEGIKNLLSFFGDSLAFQLNKHADNLESDLIQAIQPPPGIDWAKMTKEQVENHAQNKGYNLILPDHCFMISSGKSIIEWLGLFLWMSRCSLSPGSPDNAGSAIQKKRLRTPGRRQLVGKRLRHRLEDVAMDPS